jgi:hypothetical protein
LLRKPLQVIMKVIVGDGLALGCSGGRGATAGVAADEEIIA